MSGSGKTTVTEGRYPRSVVDGFARTLWRRMPLESAARMCGVSAGQVARWRDGAAVTDRMACLVAMGLAAYDMGMVGRFGRVDVGTGRLAARVAGDTVVVELHRPAVVARRMPRRVNA